jgi:hypothetical protein
MRAISITVVALLLGAASLSARAAELQPPTDDQGRFWLYGERQDEAGAWIPYPEVAVWSGWMPENVTDLLDKDQTSLTCTEQPRTGKLCWRTVLKKWVAPYWCGIAWFTKDQGTPWKAPDDTWPAYDLSKATKLVFWARGAEGDEMIQVKIGILSDKGRYGDQSGFPIATDWLKLTTQWKEYEVPLGDDADRLKRIVNPFTLILSRDSQIDARQGLTIYIDDIYYVIGR